MPKHSAGLLPFHRDPDDGALRVFVAHPGGPFWARKDAGVWSVVKGEYDPGSEEPRAAAAREFEEETGVPAPGRATVGGAGRVRGGEAGPVEQPDVVGEGTTDVVPGEWLDLGEVRQNSRKIVRAFAVAVDPQQLAFVASNEVETEFPHGSGRIITVPEVDRAEWMDVDIARERLMPGQRPLLDRLEEMTRP